MKSTVSALYLDPIWRDRMTSYNGKTIVYDSLGNPKSYDGNTYVWEGRQLKSISNANGKTEFTYDADGLRTETKVTDANGHLVQLDVYYWKNGVLDSHKLITPGKAEVAKILYDSNNQPRGYILNNQETILFVKNLQGDVVDLVDANGKYLVDFHYDAWGNMDYRHAPSITQAQANRYMKLCPLTYRGYNYDFSTGLYYLQSRYYNPEWGHFLNCDDTSILLATQGETHGANLFAYCNNNPVNRVDYNGKNNLPFLSEVMELFIPIYAAEKRLREVGLSNAVDSAINTTFYISVDSQSGILQYNFSFDLQKEKNYHQFYSFSYYYGTTAQWDSYITSLEQNWRIRLLTNLGFGLAVGVVTSIYLSPIGGLLAGAGFTIIASVAGNKKSFATASRAVLDNTPYNDRYGYLDRVVDTSTGSFYPITITKYKGDSAIHVIS